MIFIYTDFGLHGPYLGQMLTVLHRDAPGVPVVNLMPDAPSHDPRAAAYLLATLVGALPGGAVLLGVVDPGVGAPDRRPLLIEADASTWVGPDNGLFSVAARQARAPSAAVITWTPPDLSASFHGRDLFAPVAARLATGQPVETKAVEDPDWLRPDWPEDLAEVIYVDGFGNAMTGLRAAGVAPTRRLALADGRTLAYARTFSEVPEGTAFWYPNALGLVEIAVNRGSAARDLGLHPGASVTL